MAPPVEHPYAVAVRHALLAAYDAQLRKAAEVADMPDVRRDGPLWIGRPSPERGFVTCRDLGSLAPDELDALLDRTVAGFADDPAVLEFEWRPGCTTGSTSTPTSAPAGWCQASARPSWQRSPAPWPATTRPRPASPFAPRPPMT